MRFVRRADNEPTINITPLIDVVFILLIFFMVSTRFVKDEKDLALELPVASAARTAAPDIALIVSVNGTGDYRVEGVPVPAARLLESLRSLRQQYPQRALRVRDDGDARHRAVVRIMDAAAAVGFARVDIATRTEH